MDWIFEGHTSVYLALILAVALLAGLWWRDRKTGWLLAVVPLALLALLYFALDRSKETKAEQIERKLHEITAAVKSRDAPGVMRHLSSQFAYGRTPREAFARQVARFLRDEWVDEIVIWDIKVDGDEVRFSAKPKGGVAKGMTFLVRTQWVKDIDKEWRMAGFTVHNPFVDTDKPLNVPDLER